MDFMTAQVGNLLANVSGDGMKNELIVDADSLRLAEDLKAADVVFDFLVFHVPPELDVSIDLHRSALAELFGQLANEMDLWKRQRQEQAKESGCDWRHLGAIELVYDLEAATPCQLDLAAVSALSEVSQPDPLVTGALYQAFCNPPYGTSFLDMEAWRSLSPSIRKTFVRDATARHMSAEEAFAKQQFTDWCDQLGLIPADAPIVLDWVGDMDREPERSMWSNYFDEGRDWWGIWCLSIWHPTRRTLAVLAASTTD